MAAAAYSFCLLSMLGRTARIRGIQRSHLRIILRQAVQFGFDWVVYANRDYCRVSVIPDGKSVIHTILCMAIYFAFCVVCRTNLDLLFLLDQSGSVGRTNHGLALQFMQSVVNYFEVGVNASRVALCTFSTGARVDFLFDTYLTTSGVVDKIGRTPYRGGLTHTASALVIAHKVFQYPVPNGARPITAGFPRVVVLITDGHSNHYSITNPARDLLATEVTVYTIGVGYADIQELNQIASDPDDDHSFLLRSFNDAAAFVELLSGTTCNCTCTIIDVLYDKRSGVSPKVRIYWDVECIRIILVLS